MRVVAVLAALMAAACAERVSGPWAPYKPVEFVVAAGPGGGSVQLARVVQSIIQKNQLIRTPVIVTNKGGGSGSLGIFFGNGIVATLMTAALLLGIWPSAMWLWRQRAARRGARPARARGE